MILVLGGFWVGESGFHRGCVGSTQALPASAFPSNYVSIKMQISYNAGNGGLVVIATRGEETGLHLPSSHPFRTNWACLEVPLSPAHHPRLRGFCPKVDIQGHGHGQPCTNHLPFFASLSPL